MTINSNCVGKIAFLSVCLQGSLLCDPVHPLVPESSQTINSRQSLAKIVNAKHPLLSTQTPLTLKEDLLWHYGLADSFVAQWVEEYVKARANNVDRLLVLVGSVAAGSATTYLLLHQKGRVNTVILGQEDHQILQRYLANPDPANSELFISAHAIRAKLDRVANQLAQYRTFYGMLANGAATAITLSTTPYDPFGALCLASLTSICGLLLLNRYWVDQDDAAVSDDINVLEGFKEYLKELQEDTYHNCFIRFFFSDWHTPSPESRLANIQKRIDVLRCKRASTADI